MAYSDDLRTRVVGAVDSGTPVAKVAKDFRISESSARRWPKRKAKTGSVGADRIGRPRGCVLDGKRGWILRQIRATGGLVTLARIQSLLLERFGLKASQSTISAFMREKCGLVHKRVTFVASERDSPRTRKIRAMWQLWLRRQETADLGERGVFVDETCVKTDMAPLRGWGRPNKPVVVKKPGGHYNTSTLVAALRHSKVFAVSVIKGPMNGEEFLKWVEKSLGPRLKPGEIVIMDNLASHKTKAVRAAFENLGVEVRYLPPYSPDWNPIEQVFSKLKHLLRKEMARTWECLVKSAKSILRKIKRQECRRYIMNSNYRFNE